MSAVAPRSRNRAPLPIDPPGHYVLHPGDVMAVRAGSTLETLLGSCVSIILADPRRTTAAMCHVVHSGRGEHAKNDTTHGDPALQRMYAELRARAIEPRLCHAFVYGGGNMFPELYGGGRHIGEQNAAWALRRLAEDGIRVLVEDLRGMRYRRVQWTVGPTLPVVVATETKDDR